jgi:hypothetical protein
MNGKLILKNPLLAYFMKPKTRYPIKKNIRLHCNLYSQKLNNHK